MGESSQRRLLARWLEAAPAPVFILYAIAASFTTYFCMYAFRKPFAAAEYSGLKLLGLELKTVLVGSQVVGYMISKYLGIKVCSEITPERRARTIVLFILAAEAALVLFAVAPPPLKMACLFLNGLPLGMIWGLVVGYLEGRKTSDVLLAGLSCSFIVASGVVKDAALYLMRHFGVSEWWMPAATGACFLPLLLLSVWLLNQIPHPSSADVQARAARDPMRRAQRLAFVKQFFPGLLLLFIVYFFLTAYRDFRDNFGIEILRGLGYSGDKGEFTRIEGGVALGLMAAIAALNLIKNNFLGFLGTYALMLSGAAVFGAATILFDLKLMSGFWWMMCTGLGCYLIYVPYNTVLFDRLIASTRVAATAAFAIQLADAIGYTGSLLIMVYKDVFQDSTSRLEFFKGITYFMAVLGLLLLAASGAYFLNRHRHAGGPPPR